MDKAHATKINKNRDEIFLNQRIWIFFKNKLRLEASSANPRLRFLLEVTIQLFSTMRVLTECQSQLKKIVTFQPLVDETIH